MTSLANPAPSMPPYKPLMLVVTKYFDSIRWVVHITDRSEISKSAAAKRNRKLEIFANGLAHAVCCSDEELQCLNEGSILPSPVSRLVG